MIVLYRKETSNKRPKRLNKAQMERFNMHMDLIVRVRRPHIEELFVSGEFYNLPAIPPAVVKNRGKRIMDYGDAGWEIPVEDYVKDGVIPADIDEQSAANSLVIWIKNNMAEFGFVNKDEFAIVVE